MSTKRKMPFPMRHRQRGPMDPMRRRLVYLYERSEFTPRQRRRIRHKENRDDISF